MITETIVTEEVDTTIVETWCDVCKSYISKAPRLQCCVAKCQYCKRDLCEACIGHETERIDDHRHVWCKSCWNKGIAYRIEIADFRDKINVLYYNWQLACKENEV